MSPMILLVLSAIAAYFVGSIPFSLIIAKVFGGIDLRKQGSGNVGATNVARSMGAKWGILALLCDASKGFAAVFILPRVLVVPEATTTHQQVLGAVLAVIGHMFSVWLKMRGGKGVATAMGAVIVMAPWGTLFSFLGFLCIALTSRIISLASIVAAITFAIAEAVMLGDQFFSSQNWSLGLFSILVPFLIIFQHRSNIKRLLHGNEPQMTFGRKGQAPIPLDDEQNPPAKADESHGKED